MCSDRNVEDWHVKTKEGLEGGKEQTSQKKQLREELLQIVEQELKRSFRAGK